MSESDVFDLITKLCKAHSKDSYGSTRPDVTKKLRSRAFEILLHLAPEATPREVPAGSPLSHLLSCYYIKSQHARSVAEQRDVCELMGFAKKIKTDKLCERGSDSECALRFLLALKDEVTPVNSSESFQPFTFGALDACLPRLPPSASHPRAPRSLPYQHFPPHVFQLPFSLSQSRLASSQPRLYTQYTVESFKSQPNKVSLLRDSEASMSVCELKTSRVPSSLTAQLSRDLALYSNSDAFDIPRLTAPRDLLIPRFEPQIEERESRETLEVQEMFRAGRAEEAGSVDIWEVASALDRVDVPLHVWEAAARLPMQQQRRVISGCAREAALWRAAYGHRLTDMHLVTEKQFIRDVIFLAIGIESQCFEWREERGVFAMRAGLSLEGLSSESVRGYVQSVLSMGTCYRRLHEFAFSDAPHSGHIYEAARDGVRQLVVSLRLRVTSVLSADGTASCGLPTLLSVLHHLEPLRYQLETVASIYKVIDTGGDGALGRGVRLMSYLYREMSLLTHGDTGDMLCRCLRRICAVYFKFIERFIFEGELDDPAGEFFISKSAAQAGAGCRQYWARGFRVLDPRAVPRLLSGLAGHILLCGKSFRLLKLCNPNDPLVLMSYGHPPIPSCSSFADVAGLRRLLDVYRTRCRFVGGERVTFEQIALKKDAERKAFAEMAAVRQAETVEKIIAERKRLAQLIVAEKQHNFRLLETAIAETEAAKKRKRYSNNKSRTGDEMDSTTADTEKDKIMEYYSKLNQEVEKRKAHSEWKLKRLQLDTERMQMLSTEERNLKREKLELEHARSSDSCSNSFYSTDSVLATSEHHDEDITDVIVNDLDTNDNNEHMQRNISENIVKIDGCNSEKFDSEGNIVKLATNIKEDIENCNIITNSEFVNTRIQAKINKQKVLAHEFGQYDNDNNITMASDRTIPQISVMLDKENNLDTFCDMEVDTYAQAVRNKNKVLGTTSSNITTFDYNYKGDKFINDAQAEAWSNKQKILGTDEDNYLLLRKNQSDTLNNKTKILTEAQMNRIKAQGTFNEPENNVPRSKSTECLTDAQKEALVNKQKVLGTEYHIELKSTLREPMNVAQEEAARNKKKILASEYGIAISSSVHGDRRAALKLDLKKTEQSEKMFLGITPTTDGTTPGDFYSQLQLETPTTAEVPLMDEPADDSPSDNSNVLNISQHLSQEIISSEGFKFPSVILEEENPEVNVEEVISTIDRSPSTVDLHWNRHFDRIKSSILNMEELYDFDNFDPFGVKGATLETTNYLSSQMELAQSKSFYSNPADIISEAQKKPYSDIFGGYSNFDDESEVALENVNMATVTACLQRSVLLPLFYQLELVNNSILTYFLVNLDMFEHLRSLRDYFFLMDGEFSRTICENLFHKLVETINPEELLNYVTLGAILDKALGSSISNVNKYSEKLSFCICEPPLSFQHSSPDALQCLALSYSVEWPTCLVLSTEALARYARCFQFLLKMRRISWTLGQDFEVLKQCAKTSRGALVRCRQYNSVQLYRHAMAALVRALDTYIVTTCIHTSWKEFEADLRKARTLDDLMGYHHAYIKKVLFRCLLNKRSAPVMRLLNDIFTIVLRFSHILRTRSWVRSAELGTYHNPCFGQLQELFQLFERLARRLQRTVRRLLEAGYQPHLAELLALININGHYDETDDAARHTPSNS